jgi:hypothetical protein
MAVFNARVFPPFVTVDLLSSVFKLHSMYLDFISSTRVFMSTFRSCTQCSTSKCQDKSASPNSGHGVSAGVVAGAVVGSIAFLALSLCLFLWWRRRNAAALQPSVQAAKDIPAPADTVLNRPDPTEKVVVTPPTANPVPNESVVRVYGNSNATINLDPTSQSSPARSDSSHSNPFGDNHSIQTTSTGSQSTNVIPIAFVPPPASVLPSGSLPQASSTSLVHNSRAPRVELNMDHMNLSVESVPLNSTSPSGAPTIPDDRSYISNGSYASDVLSEVPTIVTSRQVASAAKAAVVPASSTRSLTSRPSTRSPLTASSFGPQDILHEADESHPLPGLVNPFADQRSSEASSSMATRGSTQTPQDLGTTGDQHPWNADSGVNDLDRPSSTYTQAASVIGADIMDATRVHLGFAQPASASVTSVYHATPLASSVTGGSSTLVRMASGRLVSNPLQRQQENSLATMQAQAQQSEKDHAIPQRISMSTMASGVSGRADSILESFTFVPPSPISNRPLRTPPRSPLVQETHRVQDPLAHVQDDDVLEPPNRQILGMSTGSQLSSMSTGLGSFPFQIDHGSEDPTGVPPSGPFIDKDEVRASLDTLTLTRDLT